MRRTLHVIWRVVKPLGAVVLAVLIVLAAVLIPTLGGSTGSVKDNLNAVVLPVEDTSGPITGDQSVFDKETACIQKYAADPDNKYVGYYPAIGAPEHTDNEKTGVMPCATFTGSFSGENTVYRYQSETTYPNGIGLVVFDGPNAGYLQTGGAVPGPGQYVSKFDPSTGKEIWRTTLTNVNISGQWLAAGSMALIKDHTIVAAAGHTSWKLDPDTGAILASHTHPVLGSPAVDSNIDGITVAPDEQGTILTKMQSRPVGCQTQTNTAMSSCPGKQPDSTFLAIDPETMETLDAIKVNQQVTARGNTTVHDGKIYIYGNGNETGVRVEWDPKTQQLTEDKSWHPKFLFGGLVGGTAPAFLGNWVIFNSNGNPSSEHPQCLFAVSQDDPNDQHKICPWGNSFPVASGATSSETPALPGVDPENNLIFAQDFLAKGVYALRLNQQTGEMTVAWKRDDWWTSDYFSMVGPPDERVLISQNINPDTKTADLNGFQYTESVLWVDEATGKTITESDYGPSTIIGSLINLGYGGRIYTMGNAGSLFIYQLQPKSSGDGS